MLMYQRGKTMHKAPLFAHRSSPPTHPRRTLWGYFKVVSLLLLCALTAATLLRVFVPGLRPGSATSSSRPAHCAWNAASSPVLYHLKTKLGVNYEGSHWFHMAENFLTQHSLVAQTNASRVFFSFDNAAFVPQLSAMTRMMVALGTVSSKSPTLHYAHLGEADSVLPLMAPGQAFVLRPSEVAVESVVALGDRVGLEGKFKEDSTSSKESRNRGVRSNNTCVKYMGTIGGKWPTPQRGHWFPHPSDIAIFRGKIRQWCGGDVARLPPRVKTQGGKRKLVIYQRDLSRRLDNQRSALEMLRTALPASEWDVSVIMHTKDRSPCSLALALRDTDVLLTPHGFQSMLLLLLPRPALLFEVFPYRYYKRGYGPLSKEYGVIHAGVMSPPLTWHGGLLLPLISTAACMLGKQCRSYARSDNVHLTQHGVNRLVAAINSKLLPALQAASDRDVLL